ncbi:hypothetical protein [EBPR siphovirus 6]|nr:hypothetical protein [EBPR siphovirus 6]
MFRSKNFRKAIYLASTPITLVLVTWGVRADNAAAYVGAGLAVANIVMAYLNVPGDEDGDGVPD